MRSLDGTTEQVSKLSFEDYYTGIQPEANEFLQLLRYSYSYKGFCFYSTGDREILGNTQLGLR